MPELKVGDMAPDFTLRSTIGDKVTLSDFRVNKNVVLLFYPLDFSPVCSAENRECAQLAPGLAPGLASDDVAVLGVSVDSLWSHRAFTEKFGITCPLLSDFHPKGEVARTAFAIGKDGKILEIVKSDVPVARDIAALLEKARAA
jgi:peroxiredoxin